MKSLKWMTACLVSVLVVSIFGTIVSMADMKLSQEDLAGILTTETNIEPVNITPEEVKEAFKESEFKEHVKDFLDGIVNSHRPDSQITNIPLDNIFIGKKPYQYAFLNQDEQLIYRTTMLNYFVFGVDETTKEITVFGTFRVTRYGKDNALSCGYVADNAFNSLASLVSKADTFAVFGFDDSHNEHDTYWQIYAVNPSNSVYNNDGTSAKVPNAEYTKVAEKEGKNVINAECFIPAYTLDGKAISDLSAENIYKTSYYSNKIQAEHTYALRNVHSGFYLQSRDNKIPSNVFQFNADIVYKGFEGINRKFKIVLAEGNGEDAYYNIISAVNDKALLDVDNASDTIGAKLKMYKQNKDYSQAQMFKFIDNGDGSYRIMPKLSKTLVLDVKGDNIKDGAEIILWDFVNVDSQKWVLFDLGDMQ